MLTVSGEKGALRNFQESIHLADYSTEYCKTYKYTDQEKGKQHT